MDVFGNHHTFELRETNMEHGVKKVSTMLRALTPAAAHQPNAVPVKVDSELRTAYAITSIQSRTQAKIVYNRLAETLHKSIINNVYVFVRHTVSSRDVCTCIHRAHGSGRATSDSEMGYEI